MKSGNRPKVRTNKYAYSLPAPTILAILPYGGAWAKIDRKLNGRIR